MRALPPPPGAPASTRPDAGRLRPADHRGTRRRHSDVAASSAGGRRHSRGGRPAVGLDRRRPPARRCGTTRAGSRAARRQVQLVRDAGALAALPIHLAYLGMAIVWTGDFAGAASLVAEIDSVAAVTGTRFPPYVLLRLRALQGKGSRGIRSDSERDRANSEGRERRPCERIGRPRSCTTASLAMSRRHRRPGEPPRTPSTIGYPRGCCPSSSRQPHAEGTPNSPAMHSSDWRRRPNPAAPSSRSASKRAAGRC